MPRLSLHNFFKVLLLKEKFQIKLCFSVASIFYLDEAFESFVVLSGTVTALVRVKVGTIVLMLEVVCIKVREIKVLILIDSVQ